MKWAHAFKETSEKLIEAKHSLSQQCLRAHCYRWVPRTLPSMESQHCKGATLQKILAVFWGVPPYISLNTCFLRIKFLKIKLPNQRVSTFLRFLIHFAKLPFRKLLSIWIASSWYITVLISSSGLQQWTLSFLKYFILEITWNTKWQTSVEVEPFKTVESFLVVIGEKEIP